jgi:hypothetical protein
VEALFPRRHRRRRTIATPDNIRSLTRPPAGRGRRQSGSRLAVTRAEAARALGVSINSFERHVQPELRIVRRGKLRLIPVSEIERWLEENAQWTV